MYEKDFYFIADFAVLMLVTKTCITCSIMLCYVYFQSLINF